MTDPAGMRSGTRQALFSALLFALSIPLVKALLPEVSVVPLSALLYLGAGVSLALFGMGRASRDAPLRGADAGWLAAVAASGGVLAPTAIFLGLRATPASEASLLGSLESVATVILAGAVFREAVGSRIWLAALAVTAGAMVLALRSSGARGAAIATGPLLVMLGTLFWALDSNLSRFLAARDPVHVAAAKGLVAGTFNLTLAALAGLPFPGAGRAAIALAIGGVSYGASLVLFMRALGAIGTSRTAALYGLAPFLGAALSLPLLHEPLTLRIVVAGGLMAAGAALVLRERHEHVHEHVPMEHEHRHVHDDHHRHAHEGTEGPEPHSHPHRHDRLVHAHPHAPDIHHRHAH
ncbi:MAG: DMT family transporter [Acidobacteriota bacterium]